MRVSSRWAQGSVVLSVDVAGAAAAECVHAVVERLTQRDLPATFAFADPVASPHHATVRAGHPANEVALLVPQSWVEPLARTKVAAELSRHAAAMSALGLRLTSLVSPGGSLDPHADLLLKRGISAVRVGSQAATPSGRRWSRWLSGRTEALAAAQSPAPRPMRFGLWEFRPLLSLPAASRLARRALDGPLDRALDGATDCGSACHVAIDAAALGRSGRSGWAALDVLLDDVERRRAAGTLSVVTLAVAARALRPRAATAAESILRAQAA